MAKTPQFLTDIMAKVRALIDWEAANKPGADHTILVNVTPSTLWRAIGQPPPKGPIPSEVTYAGRKLRAVKRP